MPSTNLLVYPARHQVLQNMHSIKSIHQSSFAGTKSSRIGIMCLVLSLSTSPPLLAPSPPGGLGASKGGLVDRLNTKHIMPILEDLVPAREDWWIDLILCILHIFWRTWCPQGTKSSRICTVLSQSTSPPLLAPSPPG